MTGTDPADSPAAPRDRPRSLAPFLPLLLVWLLWILFSTVGIAGMWVAARITGIHGFFDAPDPAAGNTGQGLAILAMAWIGFSLLAAIVVAVRLHRRLRNLRAAEMDAAAGKETDGPDRATTASGPTVKPPTT